jgi:hypothetical protein
MQARRTLGFLDCIRAEIEGDSPWVEPKRLDGAVDAVLRGGDFVLGALRQFKIDRDEWYRDISGVQAHFLADRAKRSDLHQLGKGWEKDLDRRVHDACRSLMRKNGKDWGLTSDERTWPDPRAIPSLWAFLGYQETRWCLVLQYGWRPDPNDSADGQHFICAAHADVLVSHDERLLAVARACPPPRPEPVHFVEWGRGILAHE